MGQYKCCCCIPVRAGVLIIALLSAAVYIAATVGLFMFKANKSTVFEQAGYTGYSTKTVNAVTYTSIGVSILFSITSLFGVVGSITQHRAMITIFKGAYWFVAIIVFLVSVAIIIVLGIDRSNIIADCALTDNRTVDICSSAYTKAMIGISIVLMVLSFIQFYFAAAISAYATRLRRTNMHEKLRNLEDFPEPPRKTEFF